MKHVAAAITFVAATCSALAAGEVSAGELLAASALGGAARRLGVTPIQKVITMLNEMLVVGKKEKHDEEVQYSAYKQFCSYTQVAKDTSITEAQAKIGLLTGTIANLEDSTEVLQHDIKKLEGDIATKQGDVKAATRVRQIQAVEYQALHKDYTETIDAIMRAIQILKSNSAPKVQATQAATVVDLLQRRFKDSKNAKRAIDAFLATVDAEDPLAEVPAGEAYGYEFQSSSVIDMLMKLQDKFADERAKLEKEELGHRHAHESLIQDYQNTIKTAETSVSTKIQMRAKHLQKTASQTGELEDMKTTKADDEKYLADLNATCNQKQTDFATRQGLRTEELEKIQEAVDILSSDKVLVSAEKHLPGALLQGRTRLAAFVQFRSTRENPSEQLRVAAYLNDEANRIGSNILSVLATRAREDPFSKVKKMIQDLITRLEEASGQELTKNEWCEDELAKNEHVRTTRTTSVDSLKIDIEALETNIAKRVAGVAELRVSLADLESEKNSTITLREQEKAQNEQVIDDAKGAQDALSQAISVLKAFYADIGQSSALLMQEGHGRGTGGKRRRQEPPPIFDAPYTGLASSGGVLSMLEVIQSDFARLEADTITAESTSTEKHTKSLSDISASIEATETTAQHEQETKQREEAELADKRTDLVNAQKELEAANTYFDQLKPTCLNSGMTYEQRNERRQEEIQSLQEALRILNGEDIAALPQA